MMMLICLILRIRCFGKSLVVVMCVCRILLLIMVMCWIICWWILRLSFIMLIIVIVSRFCNVVLFLVI